MSYWRTTGRKSITVFIFYFFNDLEEYFIQLDGIPLEHLCHKLESELHIFYKLFVILYADDTVIFAETKDEMQKALNIFHSYCQTWKLQVNVNKTKVMVFSKRKNRQNFTFTLEGKELEIVDAYSYLGVIFKYNGNFSDTKKKLVDQAQKSMYCLFKLIRNEIIPVDI